MYREMFCCELSLTPFCSHVITQYHQVPDEYFTSAVVLSLILAALFGLVYLLIIPQYVQQANMLLSFPLLSPFKCNPLNSLHFPLSVFLPQGHCGASSSRLLHLFPCGLYYVPAYN